MLELIDELRTLTLKKKIIENEMSRVESGNISRGSITIYAKINSYAHRYDENLGSKFPFDRELFKDYLNNELQLVKEKIEHQVKLINDSID